jgi:autotransporter-associated beta strand protein
VFIACDFMKDYWQTIRNTNYTSRIITIQHKYTPYMKMKITSKITPRRMLLASISLILSHSAWAGDNWQNTGTDWNTASDWSAGVPTNQVYPVFGTNPVDQPNLSASDETNTLIFRSLTAGYDITATNGATLTLDGGYNNGDGSPYSYVFESSAVNTTIAAPIAVDSSVLDDFAQDAGGGTLTLSGVISSDPNTNTSSANNPGGPGTGEIDFYARAGATVAVTGANTFPNAVLASGGGTVQVNTIGNTGGFTSALGENSTINVTSSTLNYAGAGETTNKTFNLTGNNTIDTTGATGPLIISTPISTPGGGVLTLTGANSGNQIAQLVNGAGPTSVTKTGAGSWTLTGVNTYTGPTTISNGTLIVASGGATGSSNVSLGAATLAGNGTIGGLVTATGAAGASNITAASTSTIGNLTLNDGVTSSNNGLTLNFGIDGAGATDSTITLGNAGLADSTGELTFNLYDLGTDSLQGDTPYTLILGTGAITDSSLAVNLLGGDGTYTLNNSYGTDGVLVGGNTATFELTAAIVPEPSAYGATVFGLLALVFARRRLGVPRP